MSRLITAAACALLSAGLLAQAPSAPPQQPSQPSTPPRPAPNPSNLGSDANGKRALFAVADLQGAVLSVDDELAVHHTGMRVAVKGELLNLFSYRVLISAGEIEGGANRTRIRATAQFINAPENHSPPA